MLELKGLNKSFRGKVAISDLSLTAQDDEYLTVLGPSGSGKSTLLRLIAGLDQPDSGEIYLNGEEITYARTHERGLGFVQQKYALFPHMTVSDNVAFGLRYREGDAVTDSAEVQRRVASILELVGLEGLGDRSVGATSGGQKQRVSLARTLVTEPKICLLDEPLGALDANLRERMTVELRKIREALRVTFMHVTGNEAEALAMGDRMIVLDDGRAAQVADPNTVFHQPATVRVARFLNAYNILGGTVENGAFVHGGTRLPLPTGVLDARSYAIRHDAPEFLEAGGTVPEGNAAMDLTFIASEFMGSRVLYIFRRADGGVFEVERHLSRADPIDIVGGEACRLTWRVQDALLYDEAGNLIKASAVRDAA
ncbi:MAG: ABC transporter ATP-binding protein [Pseudomonadota bacterium]